MRQWIGIGIAALALGLNGLTAICAPAQTTQRSSPWSWLTGDGENRRDASQPEKPSADRLPHATSPPATPQAGRPFTQQGTPGTTGSNSQNSAGANPSSGSSPTGSSAASQQPAYTGKIHVLRQMSCNIPFTADPTKDPAPELQLFVSQDQGATWKLYAKASPSARHFTFKAPADGEYWFALRSLAQGTPPVDVNKLSPGLKVVFDTAEPELQFTARLTDDGQVSTTWKANDLTLNTDTLKVEYLSDPQSLWQSVTLPPSRREADGAIVGNYMWRASGQSDTVVVRAEISDRAGNKTVVSRRLLAGPDGISRSTDGFRPRETDVVPHLPAQEGQTWPVSNKLPEQPQSPAEPYGELPPPKPAKPAADRMPSAATPPRTPFKTANQLTQSQAPGFNYPLPPSAVPPMVQSQDTGTSEQEEVLTPDSTQPMSGDAVPPPAAVESLPNSTSDYSPSPQPTSNPPPTATSGSLSHGDRPRMTNSKQFSLDYEIDALSPRGLSKVQLWGTSDGGRTWSHWQDDLDQVSPMDVSVEQDGIYGFRIVIVGTNQLASAQPRPGDPADIWVGVDTSQPAARITAAMYGEGDHAGQLDIRWQASDLWFADRPITLLFSEHPNGPWITIAAGLPNSGQYFWTVDPRIPREIYLRIEARDEAGNFAEHQINDAISTAGLIPQGRIRGLRVNSAPPSNDRSAARGWPGR